MTSITNSSAISSAAQLQSLRQELFAKADTSKDGTLSVDEFQQISSSALQQTGIINTSEPDTKASLKAIFNQLDTDGDGKLTQAEIEKGASLTTQIHAVLLQIQEDQSGALLGGLLGGSDDSSDLSSIFNSGMGSTMAGLGLSGSSGSSGGNDQLSALIQQLMSTYNTTASNTESSGSSSSTGTTVSQSA